MASTSGENISGLREQILINAVHAFQPIVINYVMDQMVKTGTAEVNNITNKAQPADLFSVVVQPDFYSDKRFIAVLTSGNILLYKTVCFGEAEATVEGALTSLLKMTGRLAAQALLPVTPDSQIVSLPCVGPGKISAMIAEKMGFVGNN